MPSAPVFNAGIRNVPPRIFPGQRITAGIHPWDDVNSGELPGLLMLLRGAAQSRSIDALGEIGLDTINGPLPLEEQAKVLTVQMKEAQVLGLPIILHIVRAHDRFLNIFDRLQPSVPVAIHGFNSPKAAEGYIRRGIYMSLGPKASENTILAVPDRLLLVETDATDPASAADINDVIKRIARIRSSTPERIRDIALENRRRFFGAIT